ncbi:MAG: hypothetical protein U5K69_07345 [Balneolaceae bacterium]|nr:hypothetical protein [Balneolaceae bacterium]
MGKIDNSLLDKYGRLLSLDFYRGITMFLLVAEGAGLWFAVVDPYFEGSIISTIGTQFHHHPWNGLPILGFGSAFLHVHRRSGYADFIWETVGAR